MFKKLTITYRFENEPDDLTTQATLTNEDPYTDGMKYEVHAVFRYEH